MIKTKEDTLEISALVFQFNNCSPSRLPRKEVLPDESVRSEIPCNHLDCASVALPRVAASDVTSRAVPEEVRMVRFKGGDDRPKVPRGSGDFEFCNVQPCYEAFIKYLRGGAVMDKREIKVTILGFTSILVIAGFLLGFITQAGAETLKSRSVATATKAEQIPVNDEPGHILVMQIAEGLALFENGETAKMRVTAVADTAPGKGGQAIVYAIYTFGDGSTVVTRSQRLMVADKSGTVSAKATGEIIKGTGRFEGIKGTVSGSSTNYLPSEGEAMKVLSDHTWTYTVPRK